MTSKNISRVTTLAAAGILLLAGFNNCGFNLLDKKMSSASSGTGACTLADSALRSPGDMDQVTNLINALPKPLTLPCFLENLKPPLKVFALQSNFSAQLSEDSTTPRVFIINRGFLLSVVPTGAGKDLLEMSTYLDANTSVKGELKFPVTANIPFSAPFDQIRTGSSGTNCRSCHLNEAPAAGFSGIAFSSAILRPTSFDHLPSNEMRRVASVCDQAADPYRCAIMRAIFITGAAQDTAFP